MRPFCKLIWVVLLCPALLAFSPGLAGAVPFGISDILQVTFDGQTQTRTLSEMPGESVTDELFFSIPHTTQFNNASVFLVEPGTVIESFPDGTVRGNQSDEVRLNVSGGPQGVTELHFTLRSDEDPGRQNRVTGFLETGELQEITALLLASSSLGNHTLQVLAASDLEAAPVPEPASLLLLGGGMIGATPFIRKKFKK